MKYLKMFESHIQKDYRVIFCIDSDDYRSFKEVIESSGSWLLLYEDEEAQNFTFISQYKIDTLARAVMLFEDSYIKKILSLPYTFYLRGCIIELESMKIVKKPSDLLDDEGNEDEEIVKDLLSFLNPLNPKSNKEVLVKIIPEKMKKYKGSVKLHGFNI